MKDVRGNNVPEFKTLKEEKEYWEARGPLAEGREGTINKPKAKQKRSSFLAVRLTGEELTQLRDLAAKQGLGPSTYARILLTSVIEPREQFENLDLNEIKNMLERLETQLTTRIYEAVKESNKYNSSTQRGK